jgi:hypothetical protein
LFTSRLFIGLMIPLILLGLLIWFAVSIDVNRNSVKVAGAIIGAADVDVVVKKCFFTEDASPRKLVLELEARNNSGTVVRLSPLTFQVVLSRKENPTSPTALEMSFRPMNYSSTCDAAPGSLSSIPSHALRSYSLTFWGDNMPRGEEWDKYFLHLEGNDEEAGFFLSKPLNPEGK